MLAHFDMFPIGAGESVGNYVAESLKIVADSGLSYQLTSMGTILEGEWPEIMAVVGRCFARMQEKTNRISCTIKVDWRKEKTGQLKYKVEAIEKRLGRKLAT